MSGGRSNGTRELRGGPVGIFCARLEAIKLEILGYLFPGMRPSLRIEKWLRASSHFGICIARQQLVMDQELTKSEPPLWEPGAFRFGIFPVRQVSPNLSTLNVMAPLQ